MVDFHNRAELACVDRIAVEFAGWAAYEVEGARGFCDLGYDDILREAVVDCIAEIFRGDGAIGLEEGGLTIPFPPTDIHLFEEKKAAGAGAGP